jgi:hypothetical protein
MRAKLLMLVAISALMLVEAYPQVCEAKGKKGSVKKKKKAKKPKTDSSVSDNPYAGDEEGAESEAAAGGEEEGEAKSAAEATAEAVEGGGGQTEGEQGGFLQQGGGGEAGSVRRSNRMEFDERLVKGQAAKSGAVYLFKRVPRRLPGLVPMRRSYRKRIVEPVLGERELKPAVYSEKPPEEPTADAPAEAAPADKPPETEAEEPKADKDKDKDKDEKK